MPTQVQKEVDVALAVYPILYKMEHPNLKTVVLVSGDGDLVDCIKALNTMQVKTYVTAWSSSANVQFSDTADEKIYLDEIFQSISKPKHGAVHTNADKLKSLNFPHRIIVAATHKYPETAKYQDCFNFAVQLVAAVQQM